MQLDIRYEASPGGGGLDIEGQYLLTGLPHLGDAVSTVEVTLLVRDDWPNPALGAESVAEHEAARLKPPAITFRRQAATVRVVAASELGYSWLAPSGPSDEPHPLEFAPAEYVAELDPAEREEIEQAFAWRQGEGKPAAPEEWQVFGQAVREVAHLLSLLSKRITSADDFDLARFTAHLDERVALLPDSAEAYDLLVPQVEAALMTRQAEADWADDIDWSEYHPAARELLPEEFFWNPADDEAPHGNDAGADLLAEYLDERPEDPREFLNAYLLEAGLGDTSTSAAALEDDQTLDEALEAGSLVIAVAFAQLKIDGRLDDDLRRQALAVANARQVLGPSEGLDLVRSVLQEPPR